MANGVFTNNSAIVDVNITPKVCEAMRAWLADHSPLYNDIQTHEHLLAELRFAKLVMYRGSVPSHYATRLLTTETVYLSRCIKKAVAEWRQDVSHANVATQHTAMNNGSTQALRGVIRYAEQLAMLLDKAANSA